MDNQMEDLIPGSINFVLELNTILIVNPLSHNFIPDF